MKTTIQTTKHQVSGFIIHEDKEYRYVADLEYKNFDDGTESLTVTDLYFPFFEFDPTDEMIKAAKIDAITKL